MDKEYFQDYIHGNVCFGCGKDNPDGLQIKSYWEGEDAVCIWVSKPMYQGREKVLNGGVLATLIDCHCMDTAMAAAYRAEERALGTTPHYRFATATISVRYLKPTPNDRPIELRAQVASLKGRKAKLTCDVLVDGIKTAEAEAVGVQVLKGGPEEDNLLR